MWRVNFNGRVWRRKERVLLAHKGANGADELVFGRERSEHEVDPRLVDGEDNSAELAFGVEDRSLIKTAVRVGDARQHPSTHIAETYDD